MLEVKEKSTGTSQHKFLNLFNKRKIQRQPSREEIAVFKWKPLPPVPPLDDSEKLPAIKRESYSDMTKLLDWHFDAIKDKDCNLKLPCLKEQTEEETIVQYDSFLPPIELGQKIRISLPPVKTPIKSCFDESCSPTRLGFDINSFQFPHSASPLLKLSEFKPTIIKEPMESTATLRYLDSNKDLQQRQMKTKHCPPSLNLNSDKPKIPNLTKGYQTRHQTDSYNFKDKVLPALSPPRSVSSEEDHQTTTDSSTMKSPQHSVASSCLSSSGPTPTFSPPLAPTALSDNSNSSILNCDQSFDMSLGSIKSQHTVLADANIPTTIPEEEEDDEEVKVEVIHKVNLKPKEKKVKKPEGNSDKQNETLTVISKKEKAESSKKGSSEKSKEELTQKSKEEITESSSEKSKEKATERSKKEVPDKVKPNTIERSKNEIPGRMKNEIPGRMKNEIPGRMKNEIPGRMKNEIPGRMKNEMPGRVKSKIIERPTKEMPFKDERMKKEFPEKISDRSMKMLDRIKEGKINRKPVVSQFNSVPKSYSTKQVPPNPLSLHAKDNNPFRPLLNNTNPFSNQPTPPPNFDSLSTLRDHLPHASSSTLRKLGPHLGLPLAHADDNTPPILNNTLPPPLRRLPPNPPTLKASKHEMNQLHLVMSHHESRYKSTL